MKTLLLLGGGGHCNSCIDVIEAEGSFAIRGIVDNRQLGLQDLLGYPFLGEDNALPQLLERGDHAIVTVGQIKSASTRVRLFNLLKSHGATLPSIASPKAHISTHCSIGEGTMVFHGAVVNVSACVGRNCIINSCALVEHNSVIGDHCHISTGAIINGDCVVGTESFVGSGAVVHNGVKIGSGCVIAAGAVVKNDLPNCTLYRG